MNPWHCTLCAEFVNPEGILTGDHYRVMHPDLDAVPESWNDGSPVVYDETVDEEFR